MNNNNRIKNSIRNSIWGFWQALASIVCPFINRTIILYVLGEEYLGLSSLFNSIFSVFNLIEAGFGTAIVYFMYKPVAEGNHEEISAILHFYRTIYRKIGGLIVSVSLLLVPILPYMSSNGYPVGLNIYVLYLIYLVNIVIPYFSFEYKISLFVANQRIDYKMRIFVTSSLIMYILQSGTLLIWRNYYLYVFLFMIQTIVFMYQVGLKTKIMYPDDLPIGDLSVEKKKNIYRKVTALIGNQIDKTVLESSDNIVISTFLGLNIVGIYGNYMYICNAVLMLLDLAFFQALLGSIGNSIALENKKNNYDKFKETLILNNIVTGFCSVCIMCLMKNVMVIWVGNKMVLPMFNQMLFVVYFYIFSLRKNIALFKNAIGMWSEDKFRPYVSIVLNIALDFLLIPYFGINGALLATIFCVSIIELPWEMWVLHKYYFSENIKEYSWIILKGIFSNTIFAVILYYILSFIQEQNIWTLAIRVALCAIGGVIYYGILNLNRIRYIIKYITNLR